MSGLFGGGTPRATPAPPAPTIDDAEAMSQAKTDELRRRRGIASTILAGTQPAPTRTQTTQAAALLGS